MKTTPVLLIVEPSPIFRSVLSRWLKSQLTSYSIFIATDGNDALWLAARERPSHILIDINLPDTTGFEIIQQMRQSLPTAKIIATGWYDSRFFLDRVRSVGADSFISKDKLRSELLLRWGISIE